MNRRLLLALVLSLGCSAGRTPEPEPYAIVPPPPLGTAAPSSIQKWAAAMQPKPVVDFFAGLFHRVGVHVSDSGEAFTVVHAGDRILFSNELDEAAVDFTVSIDSAQVDRMLDYMARGELDERARFRVMAVIATPATRAMLAKPRTRRGRKLQAQELR